MAAIHRQNTPRFIIISESGTGQTKYLGLALFFLPLWADGKNPTQSYCQSTVLVVPSAKGG
jgi:hypothetical protein